MLSAKLISAQHTWPQARSPASKRSLDEGPSQLPPPTASALDSFPQRPPLPLQRLKRQTISFEDEPVPGTHMEFYMQYSSRLDSLTANAVIREQASISNQNPYPHVLLRQ